MTVRDYDAEIARLKNENAELRTAIRRYVDASDSPMATTPAELNQVMAKIEGTFAALRAIATTAPEGEDKR